MSGLYEKMLTKIRDEQLEELFLHMSFFGMERICELVKELKKNKSVKRVIVSHCGLGESFGGVLGDVLKVNTSVTMLDIWDNNLGPEAARAISEALKVNKSVKWLSIYKNDLGSKGAQAICEALKVNYTLKQLYLFFNNFGAEGTQSVLDALQENGSLIACEVDKFFDEMNSLCKRNIAMHKRARESVVHLLALRKMRKILWIPREIIVMIAQMLWKTKCDVNVWNHKV